MTNPHIKRVLNNMMLSAQEITPTGEQLSVLKHGFNSFMHLIKKGETITAGDMAQRIVIFYDQSTPQTNAIVKTMQTFKHYFYTKSNY